MKFANLSRKTPVIALVALIGALGAACPAFAQTFSSGSSGADGTFSPGANTVVTLPPDGVLNYTTVTVPAGVTVTFLRNVANTPVTLLATGDVTIAGTLSVNGNPGPSASSTGTTVMQGALGGPGGFRGGNGAVTGGTAQSAGQGPGGGSSSYGAPTNFVSLIPLFGGSGGVGGSIYPGAGGGAGGGAGAIVVASSTKITVTGSITADGGGGGLLGTGCGGQAGHGSGGAIRLVAPLFAGSGTVRAIGGTASNCGVGGPGKIRVEAFSSTFSGTYNPTPSNGANISTVPGPVSGASTPALVALPTIAITSIGGVAAPSLPGGSYSLADVALAQGATNPVAVVVAASNTPIIAAVKVALIPQASSTVTLVNATLTGTFASSTATASVTLPAGLVSVIQAWATMTLTGQVASLLPSIDGDPAESIRLAAAGGGASSLSLVTKSGKEQRLEEFSPADQAKVALAWQSMTAQREAK